MRSIALVLLGLLAHEQAAFRTSVALVRLDAEVTDHGPPVEDLAKEDFRVTDNGEPREIVHFGHDEEPLDVILLFDTSLSMKPVVERIAETANVALAELRAVDRVAVMAFSRGSDLLLDFTADFDGRARRDPARARAPVHSLQRVAARDR